MRTLDDSSSTRSVSATDDVPGVAARLCVTLIRGYQLVLRPLIPPSCRFVPSCSEYARDAVLAHGVTRGAWLAVRRTARCNGWHPGGFDPVPGARG
jgi:putative membrane protein insertion efficiency factor